MIDIIYNTSAKFFLEEYNSNASGIMSIMSSAIINKQSVATLYAGKGSAAEVNINNFIMECKAAYK